MEEISGNITDFTTNTASTSAAAAAPSSPPVQEGSHTRRERMFNKVVTPSDVGKLNRLVIPKQHAEKYFPLDTSPDQKGLLLNFEDSAGKSWRFRYSYWNSSQSYVMTKGWSRFVKEKKLIAGDIIYFERTVSDQPDEVRLFIGWKHHPNAPLDSSSLFGSNMFWPVGSGRPTASRHGGYSYDHYGHGLGNVESRTKSLFYLRGSTRPPHGQTDVIAVTSQAVSPPEKFEPLPLVHAKSSAKRVRLFGVNLDCPKTMEEDDEDEQDIESSRCGTGRGDDCGDGISCPGSMPIWFPRNPSDHLELRLHAGRANTQLLTPAKFSQQELNGESATNGFAPPT